MSPELLTVVLSVAAFAAVVIGPVVTSRYTLRQTQLQHEHTRQLAAEERADEMRMAEHKELAAKVDQLIDLRAKLQPIQGAKSDPEWSQREWFYGKAYGLILSINDPRIRACAPRIMLEQWTDTKQPNPKLAALDDAISLIGDKLASGE